MANITKINSSKGLVEFTQQDLIENNLLRYIRTSFKGIGKQGLLADHPFETVAAIMFKDKYPSDQVKLAEKCILKYNSNSDPSVDVVLRISKDVSDQMYENHPTKIIFKKQEKKKGK
jgi:hypothetical protein